MNNMDEYINKLNLYSKMVKAGQINEDLAFVEDMRDRIYGEIKK